MNAQDNSSGQAQARQKDVEIGALWTRVSKTGQRYMAGKIEIDPISVMTERQIKVVAFPNSNKTSDKQPDLRLFMSRMDSETEPASPVATTPVGQANKTRDDAEQLPVDEDVPF